MIELLERIGKAKIKKDCTIERHKIIAIAITKSGRVITSETNRKGEGWVSKFSIHAEQGLVRKLRKIKAKERFGPISVFVGRLATTGLWKLSKPCNRCHKLMSDYGITAISYTDDDGAMREDK